MDLLRMASGDLATFLEENLPKLSKNWWQNNVIDCLTFEQRKIASERGFTSTRQLDPSTRIGSSFPRLSVGSVMAEIG
jgi:ATP-dependent helicase HepA